jgi:PAS domain-containing protein
LVKVEETDPELNISWVSPVQNDGFIHFATQTVRLVFKPEIQDLGYGHDHCKVPGCEIRLEFYDQKTGKFLRIATIPYETPYYDLDGDFAGYMGLCLDVTERRQARDGLQRYRVLSEKARDIMLFIDMDGRIIEANAAAVKSYGYSYDEL